MKLRKISGTNIKGGTFTYDLDDATAIIGPNFSRKTAIIEAIVLLLKAYLPWVGKLPKATWELSSGSELCVGGKLDNGERLSRRLWLDGSTVKMVSHRDGPGDPDEYVELPLLDSEHYFGLTDSQRTAYVFERIKLPDSYTPEAIVAECERLSLGEEHTEQVQKAKGELVRDVELAFQAVPKPTIQEALSEAIDTMRERFTYWNKRKNETQGAVTTMAELKLREKTVVAAAAGVDQRIEQARGELDRLNTQKGQFQGQQSEAERTAKRRAAIRAELDADQTDYERLIKRIDGQIKTAEKRRIAAKVDGESLRQELDRLLRKHQTDTAEFRQRGKSISEWMGALEELDDLASCPYCKSKGKGWKANLETELNAKLKPAQEVQVEARKVLEELDGKIAALQEQIRAFDHAVSVNSEVKSEVETLFREREKHLESAKREARRREELQQEFDALGVLPEESDLTAKIETLETAIRDFRKDLGELQDKKDAETRLQQDLLRAAQAELEHQDAAAHVVMIKTIAKLLKEKREAMITEAFTGLLAIANAMVVGILKSPLDLHENTVGRWEGSKFIPHRVFSGTEKALAYIAIAVALSSTAPIKLVILDEFGRLDPDNQYKVLLRLGILVADGIIDQFIVVGTSLPPQLETSNLHLEVINLK